MRNLPFGMGIPPIESPGLVKAIAGSEPAPTVVTVPGNTAVIRPVPGREGIIVKQVEVIPRTALVEDVRNYYRTDRRLKYRTR